MFAGKALGSTYHYTETWSHYTAGFLFVCLFVLAGCNENAQILRMQHDT